MKEQRNNNEYHRADPGYRRRMQILLVLVLAAGAGGLFLLHRWLSGLPAIVAGGNLFAYERALHWALGGVSLLLGATAAAFAAWLFRLAAATKVERRWPPTTMRTSADVRIRYLTSADAMVAQMKAAPSRCACWRCACCLGIWLLLPN